MVAFLEGGLAAGARATVEEHIASCSACAELVTWVAADQGGSNTIRLAGYEGTPFVGQLHPGSRVGRYQILGAVGRGGMGEVYAAYHPDLDRRIALKVVQGFDRGSGERRTRLLREARAIGRLSHPNVVTVHDAGTFGDRVFIVMELIVGKTIDQWLRAEPRTWQQVLDVFIDAGRGLAAAHAAGVVHRDFKPQNVMIGKNGVVRVMDFGLARLAQEESSEKRAVADEESTVDLGPVTKTGAFIGTPAYMSPEQFRREATDARSDQFSFCVALHEALFGTRPATASAEGGSATYPGSRPSRRAGVPGWLRAIVLRGAAVDRDQRYPSMDALLAALQRGRKRTQRHLSAIGAALAVVVVSFGAWRVARGNRFVCKVPQDRLAAAWATAPDDARRQSIHRAFAASGRATAETSWQRVSKVLDDYMQAWSVMYVDTCEATHVRGEQSAEVLDLRMSCLNDNLDQVRALTNAFVAANKDVVSHAVTASLDLTPASRCSDVPLLRSAVPLPRDERTLHEVQRLRRALSAVQTMIDLGDFGEALGQAKALRPEVEATGYEALLAELTYLIGLTESEIDEDVSTAESHARQTLILAERAHDDLTAAKAATNLVYLTGYRLGRQQDAEFWAGLGQAILDRIGGHQERLRSWLIGALAAARARSGDFKQARLLAEDAVRLRAQCLGTEHPDYAASLAELAYVLTHDGHPAEALIAATRAVEIFTKYSDPDALGLGYAYNNQGEVLNALGKYVEAESAFQNALRVLSKNVGTMHPETGYSRQGLGDCRLALGDPPGAVRFFKEALRIRQRPHTDPVLVADSEFGLARALWAVGDRKKSRVLATAAATDYRNAGRTNPKATTWLIDHRQ